MKKRILFTALTLITAIVAQSQVTQINSNKSLQVTFPLDNINTIIVSDIDSSIWITDGTILGTIQISTAIKYEETGGLLSGKFIFRGWSAATGSEIFITDGTPSGTVLLKDIYTGITGSDPGDFTMLNGFIYFSAVTAAAGRELWRTDGKPSTTTIIKDIVPGTGSSNDLDKYHLFSNGNYLLFAANTVTEGLELWKSDGTSSGTILLKNINTSADSSNPKNFYLLNNLVLFTAKDATHGDEIWKTDGTAVGTVLVKDINVGMASATSIDFFGFSFPILSSFHSFNNRAYFTATDGNSTGQLWSTDGTTANTTLLKDIVPGMSFSLILLIDAVNLPTKFIFPVSDGSSRSELWQCDGTTNGTTLFKSFTPITPGEPPFIALPYTYDIVNGILGQSLFQGTKFFFTAGNTTTGNELWISDGTLPGTTMIKDINPGTGDGIDNAGNTSFLYTSSFFFFAANNGTHGNELWKTDGTLSGTVMVQDINLNAADANPELTFVNNNKIIFSATDGDDAVKTDLFVVDGSFVPLPIKLTGFSVTVANKDALLKWVTTQEINVKEFTIQRSDDAIHFENIGLVLASGNAGNRHTYNFTDPAIINSGKKILYYRLLTTDNDGRTEYSNIISLKLNSLKWDIQLLGNPVTENIYVIVSGPTSKLQASLFNSEGKNIYKNNLLSGNTPILIPTGNLPHGFYILTIINGNEKKSISFIK